MQTIYLVSCASKKQSAAAPAKDMYISDLFKEAMTYVESTDSSWFILSAKYGLLSSEEIIKPYNETLNKMKVQDRRLWADRVLAALKSVLVPGDEVIFFAGMKYREFLAGPLTQMNIKVVVPLEGLRIGQQLQRLKRRNHGKT